MKQAAFVVRGFRFLSGFPSSSWDEKLFRPNPNASPQRSTTIFQLKSLIPLHRLRDGSSLFAGEVAKLIRPFAAAVGNNVHAIDGVF